MLREYVGNFITQQCGGETIFNMRRCSFDVTIDPRMIRGAIRCENTPLSNAFFDFKLALSIYSKTCTVVHFLPIWNPTCVPLDQKYNLLHAGTNFKFYLRRARFASSTMPPNN